MIEDDVKNVDLFDMDADDASLSFLDKKTNNKDGIYRPNIKDAQDKTKGYIATIRFLPNLLADGSVGPSALEKFQHYAKLSDNQSLSGYYDCAKNKEPKCDICNTFWKLKNSKNQAEVERSELIKRSAKYYSYIQVIEDVQHPELVGKVLIYSYGVKIKDKINLEKTGEVTGEKCNVFSIDNGKDFRLILKQIGEYQNYDASSFREKSAIKLMDEKAGKLKEVPTEFDETKGRNVITNQKVQKMIREYLLKRDVELSEFEAKEWTDEERGKITQIIDIVLGNDISNASASVKTNGSTSSKKTKSSFDNDDNDEDIDNFFEEGEDDE